MGIKYKEGSRFDDKVERFVDKGKSNANSVIISRFKIDQQLNLYDGTKADIPDMWDDSRVSDYSVVVNFKKDIINALHSIEQDISNVINLEELRSIDNSPQAIIDEAYNITGDEAYIILWEKVKDNII